jgi:hypothetical protein
MLSHTERGKLGAKTFWQKYKTDDFFRNRVLNKWRESRIRNYEKVIKSLHKVDESEREILRSRLCGFLAADGSVFIRKELKTGKVHHEIRFYPDNDVLVELFNKAFEKLYGSKTHIKQDGKYFRLSANNKFAVMDLLSIAKFSSKNWSLPKILNSKKAQIEWLKCYFDCDGYIGKKYIQIQSVNKKGLQQMQKLLKSLILNLKSILIKESKNLGIQIIY